MNSFSFKRLGLLLRREIVENSKAVLLAMLAILGFLLIIFLLINRQQGANQTNGLTVFTGFYIMGIVLLGLFVVGMAFPDFRTKGRTITLLTLPASNLEKWLSSYLLTTVGFLTIFHIGAFIFYYACVLITGHGYTLKLEFSEIFRHVAINFLFFHSLFFLGAIIFKRIPVLFSGIIVITFILIFLIVFAAIGLNTHHMHFDISLENFTFTLTSMNLGKYNLAIFSRYIWFAFPILLWLTSYFKFKEKEIA